MASAIRCVAHKGGGRLAAPNTLASFDAALELGVDMIEFDVLRWRRKLVLSHDPLHALRHNPTRLSDALAHLSADRFSHVTFNVDLKRGGYERQTLDALEHFGLLQRSLISSQSLRTLRRVRSHRPDARIGLSVGGRLARVMQRWPRGQLSAHIERRVAELRCEALMLFHKIASAEVCDLVRDVGCELFCWTVDEPAHVDRLRQLGVSGIITNDPRRILSVLTPAPAAVALA